MTEWLDEVSLASPALCYTTAKPPGSDEGSGAGVVGVDVVDEEDIWNLWSLSLALSILALSTGFFIASSTFFIISALGFQVLNCLCSMK